MHAGSGAGACRWRLAFLERELRARRLIELLGGSPIAPALEQLDLGDQLLDQRFATGQHALEFHRIVGKLVDRQPHARILLDAMRGKQLIL
jgi:hypothetical protein